MRAALIRKWLAPGLLGLAGCVALPLPAFTDVAAVSSRQRSEKKAFTDSEIIDGFMKTAFGAEYHLAGRVDRIRKYHAPVRIFVDGSARTDRQTPKRPSELSNAQPKASGAGELPS